MPAYFLAHYARGARIASLCWMDNEPEISKEGLEPAASARSPVDGESAIDVEQRAGAEFLSNLVSKLQPMLRDSMRSHRIVLAYDSYGTVVLASDGTFVHVDHANQEDRLVPVQVLQAEPSLGAILTRIEADLVAAADSSGAAAADIVRRARDSLRVAAGRVNGPLASGAE